MNKLIPRKQRTISGIGINDSPYIVTGNKIFMAWRGMIRRCYGNDFRIPSYSDCEVCEEWKYYSNFEEWALKQDWHGKTLDKDLLAPTRHGKLYAPEYCCFISRALNSKITHIGKSVPTKNNGVHFDKVIKMFKAQASVLGKTFWLGKFHIEAEAKEATKQFRPKAAKIKADHLIEIAKKETDPRIKKGLRNLANKIIESAAII